MSSENSKPVLQVERELAPYEDKLEAFHRGQLITAEWLEEFIILRRDEEISEQSELIYQPLCKTQPQSRSQGAQPQTPSQGEGKSNISDLALLPEKIENAIGNALKAVTQATTRTMEDEELSGKVLLKRLNDHAIYRFGQLQYLALQNSASGNGLNDVLNCVGISNAIIEYFDGQRARARRQRPLQSFVLSLAGSLEAMDSVCVNYGVISALILTMTFGNFGAITKDDWNAYLLLAVQEDTCQSIARADIAAAQARNETCNLNSVLDESILIGRSVYCYDAMAAVADAPTMNLSGTGEMCCEGAIECASWITWNLELSFSLGCGGGSAILILVVLFTSFLYISLHASKANRSRYEESRQIASRFRQEFLVLHILFVLGIFFAFGGITAVMALKVTTLRLSYLVYALIITAGCCAGCILIKCVWEIFFLNRAIDEIRRANQAERYELANKNSRMTVSMDFPRPRSDPGRKRAERQGLHTSTPVEENGKGWISNGITTATHKVRKLGQYEA